MDGWDAIASQRITAILEELTQEDDRDGGRMFDETVPAVDAEDAEVMLHVTGNVIAADIIQMDQQAVVRAPEPIRTTTTVIPKIKHGMMLGEHQIALLNRIDQNLATVGDRRAFDGYVARSLNRLLRGIRDRRELILVGMMIDDFDYNRFGIIMANLSWGMPAALKATATLVWSNAAATPITDLETLLQTAEDTYGEEYDTIVMTRQAFNEMTATDEWAERAQSIIPLGAFVTGAIPSAGNQQDQLMITEAMLKRRRGDGTPRSIMIKVYNKRTYIEAEDGSKATQQFLPDEAVILMDSRDAGSAEPWDFANAVVIESFPGMVPALLGDEFPAERPGPLAYATGGDPQGNPPGQVLWAVQRGFPRKHRESVNARLSV